MIPDRIWDKISLDPATDCWVWNGYRLPFGYGQAYFDGARLRVHRVMYEEFIAAIPDGLVLDHLCQNPPCCNPWHLEPVPQAENVRRGRGGRWQTDKTHCPSGHAYDEANTRVYQGRRYCRACIRDDSRVRRARLRALQDVAP